MPPEICVSSRKSYYLVLIKDGDPTGNQLTISFEEFNMNTNSTSTGWFLIKQFIHAPTNLLYNTMMMDFSQTTKSSKVKIILWTH